MIEGRTEIEVPRQTKEQLPCSWCHLPTFAQREIEPARKGRELARRADEILGTPPPELSGLGTKDLVTLRRILGEVDPRK